MPVQLGEREDVAEVICAEGRAQSVTVILSACPEERKRRREAKDLAPQDDRRGYGRRVTAVLAMELGERPNSPREVEQWQSGSPVSWCSSSPSLPRAAATMGRS